MSKLRRRIVGQSRNMAAGAAEFHPYGTSDTPMVMPMVRVYFNGSGGQVEQMSPIVADRNGGAIPATAPGQYGQVRIAGGGRY